MIQVVNKIYQQRTLREKFLLLGFVLLLFIIWSQSFFNKFSDWNIQRKFTSTELINQEAWLDRKVQYAEELAIALEKLEPSKTFSSAQLSGQLDALIREIKLEDKTDIDPVQTQTSEIFNDHSLRLRLKGVSIEEFILFSNGLVTFFPYISPKSIRIDKNQKRPEELNIVFEIISFDLTKQSI